MVSSVVASQLCSPEGRASHQEGPPDSLPLKDTHAGGARLLMASAWARDRLMGRGVVRGWLPWTQDEWWGEHCSHRACSSSKPKLRPGQRNRVFLCFRSSLQGPGESGSGQRERWPQSQGACPHRDGPGGGQEAQSLLPSLPDPSPGPRS